MTAETIGLAITNIVVVIGWFVVFRQALHIKRRDDLRKLVDLSTNVIDEIYNLTCKYYSSSLNGHINHDSTNLRAKFVLLSHYLLMLRSANISTGISAALTQYKIHATGGYFETVGFQNQNAVPNWQNDLASAAQELRFRIEKGYFDLSRAKTLFFL